MPGSESEIREELRWKYRIFASADIIGSTDFKSKNTGSGSWSELFQNFFTEFPATLESKYVECQRNLGPGIELPETRFEVWKYAGDEILFSCETRDAVATALHVVSMRRAANEYSKKFEDSEKYRYSGLGLKATLWVAGFPVTNTEVRPQVSGPVDYLGPQIDLGFRLAKYADHHRIPIPADLVWILLRGKSQFKLAEDIEICCEEFHALKGINSNVPYPIFWLNRLPKGERTSEDQLLGKTFALKDDDAVRTYLDSFYLKYRKNGVVKPFISGAPQTDLAIVDPEIEKLRENLIADRLARVSAERDTPPPPVPATVTMPANSDEVKTVQRVDRSPPTM